MFPEKMRTGKEDIVATGFPTLLAAMDEFGIVTPRQRAGFLTTVAYESNGEFNRKAVNETRTHASLGYFQLTHVDNYRAASEFFGVDFVINYEWVRSLEWSARIAGWYWTKARPLCNTFAEELRMGKVNRMIGYPLGDGAEDHRRCAAFARAIKYQTNVEPTGIDCNR